MIYAKAFFDLQLRFAQTVAALSRLSLAETVFEERRLRRYSANIRSWPSSFPETAPRIPPASPQPPAIALGRDERAGVVHDFIL
jgi:hypothetical protein